MFTIALWCFSKLFLNSPCLTAMVEATISLSSTSSLMTGSYVMLWLIRSLRDLLELAIVKQFVQ